jgi:3',5'-cyclic AMP phosphodiesterase CpdA
MLLVSDVHFARVDRDQHDAFLRAADDEARGDRIVVIAGDLTYDGTPSEYAEATAFVDGLQARGLRVVLTPGNHDFGNRLERRIVDDACRDRYRALARRVQDWWVARPHEGTHVLSDDAFDSITRIEHHVFVALRSVHSYAGLKHPNRVRSEQIAWAERGLRHHRREGDVLHFVTHRSLWKLPQDKHRAMHESKRLSRNLLAPHGFRTFIHGHNHVHVDRHALLPGTDHPVRHLSVTTLSDRLEEPRTRAWNTLALADLTVP